MNYEKAYKAVLQTATQWIKDGCTDKEKICLECVFPELRESDSEDEMVRKELIGALMWQRDNFGTKGPHANNIILPGFTMKVGKILAFLEKQKEPHYIKRNALFDKCVENCDPKVMKEVSDEIAEIERRMKEGYSSGDDDVDSVARGVCAGILSFLDTLSEEPAPKGYDEAYLNEKIAKASKTWEGVDVDKYMDEVRGREPDKSLEEAADEYEQTRKDTDARSDNEIVRRAFIAGAQWQEEQFEKNRLAHCDAASKEDYDRETDFVMEIIEKEHRQPTFDDAIKYGMRLQKEQKSAEWSEEDEEMLEYVIGDVNDAKQLFATKDAIALCDREIAWLKSLRPSWKPSEWQMSMLLAVINDPNNAGAESCQIALKSLYEQLKKLM